jgi:hypothetical protein
MILNWEYCECGCSGHCVTVGTVHLWLYNALNNGGFHLYDGHGADFSKKIASPFNSFEEADRAAAEYAKPLLEKQKAKIETGLRTIEEGLTALG